MTARYNWSQGPVPGRGPAVEKHWFKLILGSWLLVEIQSGHFLKITQDQAYQTLNKGRNPLRRRIINVTFLQPNTRDSWSDTRNVTEFFPSARKSATASHVPSNSAVLKIGPSPRELSLATYTSPIPATWQSWLCPHRDQWRIHTCSHNSIFIILLITLLFYIFHVKVKLCLCLTEHHAMKTFWRSEGTAPSIPNLDTRRRWGVSLTPRLLSYQNL
jgi:hypothetical protein